MSRQIIIEDGIINNREFQNETVKLLWVLKEANDPDANEGWDMRIFLSKRKSKDGLFSYYKWRSTFGLICKISYGVLDKFSFKDIDTFDDVKLTKVLDRIAYINIKKSPGGSVVDNKKFNEYISNPNNLKAVRKQINDIKPNIVVCGNTFHYLFPNQKKINIYEDWIYKIKGIKYLNGYHPNVRSNHKKYFEEVMNVLKLSSP